jgi:hypothetical protein
MNDLAIATWMVSTTIILLAIMVGVWNIGKTLENRK